MISAPEMMQICDENKLAAKFTDYGYPNFHPPDSLRYLTALSLGFKSLICNGRNHENQTNGNGFIQPYEFGGCAYDGSYTQFSMSKKAGHAVNLEE